MAITDERMSTSVVSIPSEKRRAERAALVFDFIASMTWDGESESARQAEPEEAQIPS